MSTIPLSIKYRPHKLSDVIGQEVAVQTLTNSFKDKSWHHAYILSGNLGCGKTSVSRIMAAMENCENGPTLDPCGKCRNCQDIFDGKSFDVKELDAANSRSIDDVREMRKDSQFSPMNSRIKYFIIDECLSHDTMIDTDTGKINISKIVHKKLNVKVKSLNEKTGDIEFKPIINWFKNSGKYVYKMIFSSKGHIYPSEGHLISTTDGYKSVKDLNIGDKVLRCGKKLSNYQKQFLYGSLLGDSSIHKNISGGKIIKNECKPRISCVHGQKQKDYLLFKKNILKNFVKTNEKEEFHCYSKKYNNNISTWRFNTITSNSFIDIYNNVCKNGKKNVTLKWLNNIDWCGMAFWFMDDGSCVLIKTKKESSYKRFINIATHGFSKKECLLLRKWLKTKGIECILILDKRCNRYGISIGGEGSNIFLKNISKYIPDCMKYKLKGFEGDIFDTSLIEYESESVIEEKIIYKKVMKYESSTYDLEIQDNHNYFANGTLVHNCHGLTGAAAEATLKFIEEPPPNVRIILCTTDPQLLKPTIHSRCISLNFSKVNWIDIFNHLINIAKLENISYDEDALKLMAKTSKGSVRNALQNLQSVASFVGKDKIDLEKTQKALGIIDDNAYFDLIDSIIKVDVPSAMIIIDKLIVKGKNVDVLIKGLNGHLRNLLLARLCEKKMADFGFIDDESKRYVHQSKDISPTLVAKMMDGLINVQKAIIVNLEPQYFLEKFAIDSIIDMVKSKKAN
jgi:DNA polymerase III gamma/tau subunit